MSIVTAIVDLTTTETCLGTRETLRTITTVMVTKITNNRDIIIKISIGTSLTCQVIIMHQRIIETMGIMKEVEIIGKIMIIVMTTINSKEAMIMTTKEVEIIRPEVGVVQAQGEVAREDLIVVDGEVAGVVEGQVEVVGVVLDRDFMNPKDP